MQPRGTLSSSTPQMKPSLIRKPKIHLIQNSSKENLKFRSQFNNNSFHKSKENGDKAPILEREFLAKCKRLQKMNNEIMSKQQIAHCIIGSLRQLRNKILERGGRDMETFCSSEVLSEKNSILLQSGCSTVVYLENCGEWLNKLINPWKDLTNRILNYFVDGFDINNQHHIFVLNEYHQEYFHLKLETEHKIQELIKALEIDPCKKDAKMDTGWQHKFMTAREQINDLETRLSRIEAENRNKLVERDRREKQLEDKVDALTKALQQQSALVRKAEEDKFNIRNENVELSKKILEKDRTHVSNLTKSLRSEKEVKLIERLEEAEKKVKQLETFLKSSEDSNKENGLILKKTQNLEKINHDLQEQLEARDRLLREQSLVVSSKNEMLDLLRDKERRLQQRLSAFEKTRGAYVLS